MAICRGCGTEIPEGAEFCEACLNKQNTAKDSESYLDSLLNAVMTEEPERREIVFPKKEASSLVSVPEEPEIVPEPAIEDEGTETDPGAEDAVWDDFMQDFFEASEEAVPEETAVFSELAEESDDSVTFPEEETAEEVPEEPPMEDVFGLFFDGDTELPDLKNYSIFGDVDESTVDRMLAEDLDEVSLDEEEDIVSGQEPDAEEEPVSDFAEFGEFGEFVGDAPEEEEVPLSEVGNIEDVFGMLEDERGADAPKEIEITESPEVISAAEFDAAADTFSGIVEMPEEETPLTEFGDFADLFAGEDTGAGTEEPVAEFGDFADLFAGDGQEEPVFTAATSQATDAPAGQTMDDFADLFGGMDGEGLFEFGAEPIEMEETPEEPAVFGQSTPTEQPAVKEPRVAGSESEPEKPKGKKFEKLVALYHKLFDDVAVDPSKIKKPPTKEELEAQKKAKQEAKERSKEEKEALLAEKKEQEKQVKQEKQRAIKEAKAEKKAKKMEEAKLLLEEMERTRINRAGASIVFIFFAMIAVVIIVGTSIFSYSLSIRNAEYEFERDEYTLAYNEIYGLEIKDEDILLYDRIMTVMYVQKQLNSYNNYYGMDDKPKALDSLLKGLQRYEKYIDLAVKLEVDTDLDSVRKKILENISESFLLTEQEAMEIIQSGSQVEYSKRVYDAVEALEQAEAE